MDTLVIPTLETERLRLRPFRTSDFEDYAALRKERIISLIHPENRASIRVAERIGERLEGHINHFEREMLCYGLDQETYLTQVAPAGCAASLAAPSRKLKTWAEVKSQRPLSAAAQAANTAWVEDSKAGQRNAREDSPPLSPGQESPAPAPEPEIQFASIVSAARKEVWG